MKSSSSILGLLCLLLSTIDVVTASAHAARRIISQPETSIQKLFGFVVTKLQEDADILSTGVYYGVTTKLISSMTRTRREVVVPVDKTVTDDKDARLADFNSIGKSVERWAEKMLSEKNTEGAGWSAVQCNKALRMKYNANGTTKQYVKWMRDSREHHADEKDTKYHPCMKLYATIDAPFDTVCRYLSRRHHYREYNSLLIDQKDVEELSTDSKICWSQTKKLLFIQPRDFVTYCFHRWKRDGTQVVVNQACDHPNIKKDGYRAYALRGATYISRDPSNPSEKTKIIMLSHCNCGDDIPEWAVRAAVGVLAPIKPFEIIHRIRKGIKRENQELGVDENNNNNNNSALRRKKESKVSDRPAGIAQMGFAAFWPKGGGMVEE